MTEMAAETRAAAALAELIYARDPGDQGMTVADIRRPTGITTLEDNAISVGDTLGGTLNYMPKSGAHNNNFYYADNGLVGAVYKSGSTFYVVLRGSDAGANAGAAEIPWDIATDAPKNTTPTPIFLPVEQVAQNYLTIDPLCRMSSLSQAISPSLVMLTSTALRGIGSSTLGQERISPLSREIN